MELSLPEATIQLQKYKRPLFSLYLQPELQGWDVCLGRYVDLEGNVLDGLYGRTTANRMEVLHIGSGKLYLKYLFPKPLSLYRHKWIHWENLLFTIGRHSLNEWEQVARGKKPMGFYIFSKERLEEVENDVRQTGLPYVINEFEANIEYFEMGICQRGRIDEHFDMNEIYESYKALCDADNFNYLVYSVNLLNKLEEIGTYSFEEFLTNWDYANPKSVFELVKTGLLLGYPIESTYAVITGNVK